VRLSSCEPEQSGRRGENSRRHLAKSKQVTFRDGMGWCICRKFHSPSSTKLPLLPQMTVEQWTFLSAATGCARGNSGSLLRHPTRRRACTHDHAPCQSRSMVRIAHTAFLCRTWDKGRLLLLHGALPSVCFLLKGENAGAIQSASDAAPGTRFLRGNRTG
jgi:hypothetical protein